MPPQKNEPDADGKSRAVPDIQSDVDRTREEFAATLDALEDRLNPKAQFRRVRAAVTKRISDDPKVLAAAAAGAAGLAAAVTGIARIASRGSRR